MAPTEPQGAEQVSVASSRDNVLIGRRIGAGLLLVSEICLFLYVSPAMAFCLLPLVLGGMVALAHVPAVTERIIQWGDKFRTHRDTAVSKEGKFHRFMMRPMWAGAHGVHGVAKGLRGPGVWRDAAYAGVCLALVTYYFGVMVLIFGFVAYMAVVVAVLIAMFLLGMWLLGKYLGGSDGASDSSGPSLMSRVASSRQKETFFGEKYVEHRDKGGNVIATSHSEDGILGMDPHVKTVDRAGNLLEESRQTDGFLGLDPHLEHTSASGDFVGASRDRDGLLGLDPHTERTDADGHKVQESRDRDGLLGLDPHVESRNE
jgi:hypothetical protein